MSALQAVGAHEHAALCRHLGGVQDRVSRLMLEKDKALTALTSEVVRLRGQLVVARTCLLWGALPPPVRMFQRQRNSASELVGTGPAPEMEAARQAICQTGCAGHAHPWLTAEGQCRWSGRVCDGGAGDR